MTGSHPELAGVSLVVDAHGTMELFSEAVTAVIDWFRDAGGAEGVRSAGTVRLLGTDHIDPGPVRPERPLTPPGDGRHALLILTDGLAAGWRSGAVIPLLRRWGSACPVAVAHLLPQYLWFRTGLDVARVRIRPPAAWSPNGELDWEVRETVLEPPADGRSTASGAEAATVPVPVLELTERWTSAWARMVTGRCAGPVDLSALQAREWKQRPDAARAGRWAQTVPDPASGLPAGERVSEFRAGASPTAFALATRLAAAPLSMPVMKALASATPGAGPVHLAELLMSGLVRPCPAPHGDEGGHREADQGLEGGDLHRSADVAFCFGPDIREELLALGRRSDTVRVLHDVRMLLGSGSGAGRALLPPASQPLDTLAMPTVTEQNVAFHRIELIALRALSGRFLRRAGMLDSVLTRYGRHNTVSLEKHVGAAAGSRIPGRGSGPGGREGPGSPPREARGADAGTTSEGAQMSTTTQAAGEGERSAQPRVWGNLPPRNPNFTGRTELLELLDERLAQGTTTVLPQAIHGMGGVGKTQLAIEYAYRHQGAYDIVWWIPAERPGQIGQSLVELAQRLGLETSREANIAGPAVREALREGRPYAHWLLIFDNADSPERVRHYFPTGGTGSILVTSRNRRWGLVGSSLEVDVFTRDESKELLHRSGPTLGEDDSDRLAEALGDLPLALEQAAAWLAETGMPVSEYLRLFEEKRTELLEVSPPPDYQLPVAAAWNVSLDHLETRSVAALRLLQLCSYFAPDPVSRSIFSGLGGSRITPELDAALNDPIRLARAVREVNRYSLARIDHRTNSIEMHRLVQAVLINRMTPEEQSRMRRGAHTLLAAADPKDPANAANWTRYAELYGHVIASRAVESDEPWVRHLVMNVARYLYHWGDHEVSLEFSEQAWKTWCSLFTEEDQHTGLMGQWLGFMYFVVGRYHDAAQLAQRLKDIYARTADPGVEDSREDALSAINFEAAVRRVEGDFAAARRLDEMVYERARRAFGEDDPTTVNVAHNLGVSLRLSGDFRAALELDRRTHELKLRMFGQDDQRTLVTEGGIAIDVRETGNYIEARALQQAVVDSSRELLGSQNPGTIRVMGHLSDACRKEGDHETALELAREVFARFTRRYGDTHPQALSAALSLSMALRQTGDLEGARDLGVKACERYRRIFDQQHPHVLSADVDLAVTLRLLGQAEEARRLDEAACASLGERLGTDHPVTLAAAINTASDLSNLGDLRAARELGMRTWELSRARLGEGHPTTLVCAANLAEDRCAVGETEEGEALRADTVERMERVLDAPRFRAGHSTGHPATQQARAGERANCDIDPMPL
ncbi:FxSxx-COOH system tetratricopeptide repeat protein [Streptomyces sp. MUM 178J]|uniref:FxSxx-COOH system tetratricopeptide repeat protein n=1 Tax=Streptomyces sp. MUM 178J TaxID=2791991 RepID=UPI001F0441FF|nr:FxSxx-COOH system tetratricopeptide repeat protein [Streptomyces sp. MUM 178J]WRQ78023.1 FxSxx-COOH system tetratricopeptide repeat protein [Streptomyces sp. MUM 178J]